MNHPSTPDPNPIRYQRDRALADVPGYTAGLQMRLSHDEEVYVAVSPTEFALYFSRSPARADAEVALHYDLEGRLTKIAEPNRYRRRSLSHRVLLTRKRTAAERGGLMRTVLAPEQADALVTEAHQLAARVWEQLQTRPDTIGSGKPSLVEAVPEICPLLERAAHFDAAAARADAARFHAVYGRVAVLPPDQYNALVLQLTEGCCYSGCAFCELYRGVPYRVKNQEEFHRHIRDAMDYHGQALRARRSLFLGEANALALPQAALTDRLRVIHDCCELPPPYQAHVPADWWLGQPTRFDGIHSFLDAFTGPPRSVSELSELRRLGLRRVYIGLESGDETLLKWLLKPATAEGMLRTVAGLKEVGVAVGVIVLLGAGGRQFYKAHVRETARLLNEMPLGEGDYVYFSPLVAGPSSPYSELASDREIEPLTPGETDQQEQAIRGALAVDPERGRPYVARYDLETFVY